MKKPPVKTPKGSLTPKIIIPPVKPKPEEIKPEEQQELKSEIQIDQPIEPDVQDLPEEKLETQNDEFEQLNDNIDHHDSSQNETEEQLPESDEREESHEQLTEDNNTLPEIHLDEVDRPESMLLTTDQNEPFVESINGSPMTEIHSKSNSEDPMTSGFIDGTPVTKNPFVNEENDNNINPNNDDDLEIVHHEISSTDEHLAPSAEEINPQGLPIEDSIQSIKPTVKRLSNTLNR